MWPAADCVVSLLWKQELRRRFDRLCTESFVFVPHGLTFWLCLLLPYMSPGLSFSTDLSQPGESYQA